MVSWDDPYGDRFGSFYMDHDEQMLRVAELERRQTLGDHTMYGYPRPVYPDCPKHHYQAVEGRCGVCVLEDKRIAERRAA